MSQKTNEELKEYLGRVMALRTEHQESLSAEEVKGIALELGLSEEDLARAEAEAEAHLARGQGYLRHQRFDDAIHELSDAVSFSPTHLAAIHTLALAYTERWKSLGKEADRQEAQRLSRRCLERDPGHEPSFTLLNVLDGKQAAPPPGPSGQVYFPHKTPKGAGGPKNAPAIMAALVAAVVAGVGALVAIASGSGGEEKTGPEHPGAHALTDSAHSPQSSAEEPLAPGDADIPAALLPSESAPGLTLNVRGSRLDNYTDSSFYKLKAELKNEGDTEITELKMKVELLNKEGKVIGTDINYTLGTHQAPIRPGDVHAFYVLEKTTPALAKARLSVQTITQEPAPTRYPAAKPVAFTWAFEKPETFSIAIRERDSRFNDYGLTSSAYFQANLEIENTGEATIHTLVLQLSFLDKEGKLLSTAEPYVVTSDSPSLLPGQIRALGGTYEVTKDFGGYRVSVLRAE